MIRPPGLNTRDGPVVTLAPARPQHVRSPLTQQGSADQSVQPGAVSDRTCQAPGCCRILPPSRRRFCSDVCRRRGQRAERRYDDGQIGEAVIRLIEALARRGEFASVWQIRAAADRIAADAIDRLRAEGSSWAELAAHTGLSRQGLAQWRGRRPARSGCQHLLRGDLR